MKTFVFLSIFFISGLNLASAQQAKLSFNPEKGTKYEYHTEIVQNIKTTVMGQEVPAEMMMRINYQMEILDKAEQGVTVQFTYNEIAHTVSSLYMKMGYDSKKPVENPSDIDGMLSKMFGEMLGKSFLAVIAPDGSVQSISGMEAIGERMTNAIAGDGQMIAQLGAQMKEQFNDSAMKNMLEQSFKFYPSNPVRVGNSWNIENATTISNINVVSKSKYTLRSINRNIAAVAVDTKIEMNPDSSAMEGNIGGTQKGSMTIDSRTGIPLTGKFTQNIKGSVKAQGVDVQMEIVSESKSTTKRINN